MIRLATMTSVCPDWGVGEIIDGMKRHGFEGLEPRAGWGHAAGIELDMAPADRDAVRAKFEDADLRICCVATGARFATEDADALNGHIDEANAAIDLAADLGAGVIRTFGGARGKGEVYWMVHRTAEAYKRVMDHAAERGVTVLLETHDEWCVSAQVRAVVEKVNHPNLAVLWDMMHTQRFMEKTEETMQTIGHLAKHLHAHDGRYDEENGRITTVGLGEGVIDHATPLGLLNDAGFDGYFSVEVIHKPGSDHDAEGTLKQYGEGFKAITGGF
ncbi:MAG: sugar phosphate isomerase/epimerase [Candidatus Latescibacteria bacterium]|jgi:sugar phosphate isomerase/epimerase|nr:sugar phosphate isomerase/epimerase [Candidatus Latescibacterota bacterium]